MHCIYKSLMNSFILSWQYNLWMAVLRGRMPSHTTYRLFIVTDGCHLTHITANSPTQTVFHCVSAVLAAYRLLLVSIQQRLFRDSGCYGRAGRCCVTLSLQYWRPSSIVCVIKVDPSVDTGVREYSVVHFSAMECQKECSAMLSKKCVYIVEFMQLWCRFRSYENTQCGRLQALFL